MFGRHLDFPWGHSWERGNQECTAISQDFTTFRERSYKRTINILRRSSSNAFFLRSAALGKSCILNTEYFIESALSLYLIGRGCWSMKSHDHFLLFHGYLSLNSSLKRAWLWYFIRPNCWGMRKFTPCAYSCLQLVFILVPWLYLNTRPLVCIYLNDKHTHCYSSLSFKAQMKWHCPLGAINLKKCLLWKQSKSTFFCLESCKD